jgi:hypothetical protein
MKKTTILRLVAAIVATLMTTAATADTAQENSTANLDVSFVLTADDVTTPGGDNSNGNDSTANEPLYMVIIPSAISLNEKDYVDITCRSCL